MSVYEAVTAEKYEQAMDRVNELYRALKRVTDACEPVVKELWETGENQPAKVIKAGEVLQAAKQML